MWLEIRVEHVTCGDIMLNCMINRSILQRFWVIYDFILTKMYYKSNGKFEHPLYMLYDPGIGDELIHSFHVDVCF